MRFPLAVAVALCSAFVLGACDDDDAGGEARLRVIHASADAPNVDVMFGGLQVFTDVPFFTATAYTDVSASDGEDFLVEAIGTDVALIDATLPLNDGDASTVLLVDSLASIEPLVLDDDLSDPPTGQFKVRAVHASPATGAVDLYVFPSADPLPANPALSDVAYKTASPYVEAPAGEYRLVVTAAGDPGTVLIDETFTFAEGEIRTIIARDNAGEPAGVSADVIEDN